MCAQVSSFRPFPYTCEFISHISIHVSYTGQ
jgi:hypothetical protein